VQAEATLGKTSYKFLGKASGRLSYVLCSKHLSRVLTFTHVLFNVLDCSKHRLSVGRPCLTQRTAEDRQEADFSRRICTEIFWLFPRTGSAVALLGGLHQGCLSLGRTSERRCW
jgi:hypothetical protein